MAMVAVGSSKNVYSDSKYGLEGNAERYFWVIYFIFGLLSSLIGDTLILIASFQRGTLKLNRFLVTIIQHIAFADLASSIHFILPTIISLLADTWVLGETLCYVRVYCAYVTYPAGMCFITVLTSSKYLLLKYPQRAACWTTKRAHILCCFIWAFLFINPVLFLIADKDDVLFDYRIYNCEYGFSSPMSKKIALPILLFFVCALAPNIAIVATTVPTLRYLASARKTARRVQGSVPWQGALTVALTAIVYCISTLPFTFYKIIVGFTKEDKDNMFQSDYYRVSYFLLMMNVMFNFYIYTLTIKSFRRFLMSRFTTVVPAVSSYYSIQET